VGGGKQAVAVDELEDSSYARLPSSRRGILPRLRALGRGRMPRLLFSPAAASPDFPRGCPSSGTIYANYFCDKLVSNVATGTREYGFAVRSGYDPSISAGNFLTRGQT
jgi:hypothetical protein